MSKNDVSRSQRFFLLSVIALFAVAIFCNDMVISKLQTGISTSPGLAEDNALAGISTSPGGELDGEGGAVGYRPAYLRLSG